MLIELAQMLAEAPDGQLDKHYRDEFKKLAEQGDRQAIFALFEKIYNGSCGCESSSFVKEVVNPKYTRAWLEPG